ncbi:hypothetical protein [Lacunimicrobium album]
MNTKTTAVPFYQTWKFRICVAILVLLFAAGAIAFHQYVRFMGLANLRYVTTMMFDSHIRSHIEKYGHFPTCKPVEEFEWLTIEDAICRKSFDPDMDDLIRGRTYENVLTFASGHQEARFAFRKGKTTGDFVVVLLIDYRKSEVERIDQLIREQKFDGSDGLEALLKRSSGFSLVCYRNEKEYHPPPEILVEFLKGFVTGDDRSIDYIWRERDADRLSKPQ